MGNTVEVILTAYPGPARTDAPVKFVTPVGNEMTMVLDDVLRSIRLKYGKWEVDHVDLTFDDRVSKMNGGSIAAALGTLVLSMLEGYEIDPKLAITGDVIADGARAADWRRRREAARARAMPAARSWPFR